MGCPVKGEEAPRPAAEPQPPTGASPPQQVSLQGLRGRWTPSILSIMTGEHAGSVNDGAGSFLVSGRGAPVLLQQQSATWRGWLPFWRSSAQTKPGEPAAAAGGSQQQQACGCPSNQSAAAAAGPLNPLNNERLYAQVSSSFLID